MCVNYNDRAVLKIEIIYAAGVALDVNFGVSHLLFVGRRNERLRRLGDYWYCSAVYLQHAGRLIKRY